MIVSQFIIHFLIILTNFHKMVDLTKDKITPTVNIATLKLKIKLLFHYKLIYEYNK